jgi:hypothetical protein
VNNRINHEGEECTKKNGQRIQMRPSLKTGTDLGRLNDRQTRTKRATADAEEFLASNAPHKQFRPSLVSGSGAEKRLSIVSCARGGKRQTIKPHASLN